MFNFRKGALKEKMSARSSLCLFDAGFRFRTLYLKIDITRLKIAGNRTIHHSDSCESKSCIIFRIHSVF